MRVFSGLVLAVCTLAVTWYDGPLFLLFFGAVCLLIYKEWVRIVGGGIFDLPALVGYCAVALSLIFLFWDQWFFAFGFLSLGLVGLIFCRKKYPYTDWCLWGYLYAGIFGLAILSLRADVVHGRAVVLVLYALVWGTDIAAYFVGKFVGGPKLWPKVSPKKTWSGSVGGFVVGTLLALLVAYLMGIAPSFGLTVLLGIFSILSQLGDLGESHIKRVFNVKDSGHLIPGHGGVMDRVDGLVAVVVAAFVLGLIFGEPGFPATFILIW